MVYPADVITVALTFGPYINDLGDAIQGEITVISSANRRWDGNGAVFIATPIVKQLEQDGTAIFFIPATDQVGYTVAGPDPDIEWSYSVISRLDGQIERVITGVLLPAAGESGVVFDFDVIAPLPGLPSS